MTLRRDFADDADLTHPWATTHRIPLVGSIYPSWNYEVALCVPAPDSDTAERFDLWGATWPSQEEALVVASAIDFRRSYYNEHWRRQMLERPLDVDGTTNTLVLIRTEATGLRTTGRRSATGPPRPRGAVTRPRGRGGRTQHKADPVRSTATRMLMLGLLLFGATTGCASGAGSVHEQGGDQLVAVAAGVHHDMLAVRSRDPEATGDAALDAYTDELGQQPDIGWSDEDGTIHATFAIAMEEVNADGSYGDEMLGACLTVTATPGRADGNVGQRGKVSTRQIECTDGLAPVRNDRYADRLVEGLRSYSDDVPMPIEEPPPCRTGSDDCVGG